MFFIIIKKVKIYTISLLEKILFVTSIQKLPRSRKMFFARCLNQLHLSGQICGAMQKPLKNSILYPIR